MPPTLDDIVIACCQRLGGSGKGLFDAAESERLSPLFYDVLRRRRWPGFVTEAEQRAFRSAYYRCAGHNVELSSTLFDVALTLGNHGIPCIAFKGADLGMRFYPSLAVRPMGDVDVYVPEDNVEQAEAALAALGYRPWCPDMTPGLSRRVRHARLYVGGQNRRTSVDLHWSLVGHPEDARAPDPDWVRRNVREDPDTPWLHLSDTAHLLYLAAHMKLQHYDEEIPLLWLIDFYLLAFRGSIKWQEVKTDGDRLGWLPAVGAVAFDIRERLDVTLPEPLAALVVAPGDALHRRGARNEPERVWNELRTSSWSGRVSLVRAYLLPSLEYIRFRYGRLGWPLGYVRRWIAMLVRAWSLVVRHFRGKSETRPLLARGKTC